MASLGALRYDLQMASGAGARAVGILGGLDAAEALARRHDGKSLLRYAMNINSHECAAVLRAHGAVE